MLTNRQLPHTLVQVVQIVVICLAFIAAGTVLADNGPHGGYTATTDACAGCHRAHTASAANLLISAVPGLCYTCHGSAATGADTNVIDGVYLERDSEVELPAEGIVSRGLKGGGFINALIDTDWDNAAASASVTSSHLDDGSLGTAWGNGAIGSGPGATDFSLSCVSCHDPHGGASTAGGATYRLLRAFPTGSGAPDGVDVTDEADKTYTVSSPDNQYFTEDYGFALRDQLSEWCSQCHTRYLAQANSGNTNSGDPIFVYRHLTFGPANCQVCHGNGHPMIIPPNPYNIPSNVLHRPACVTCHVAHGTPAGMGDNSGVVPWPDGTTTPAGNNRSSLLRVDNRGVCELCHGK